MHVWSTQSPAEQYFLCMSHQRCCCQTTVTTTAGRPARLQEDVVDLHEFWARELASMSKKSTRFDEGAEYDLLCFQTTTKVCMLEAVEGILRRKLPSCYVQSADIRKGCGLYWQPCTITLRQRSDERHGHVAAARLLLRSSPRGVPST